MSVVRVELVQGALSPVDLSPSGPVRAFPSRDAYVLLHGAGDASIFLDGVSVRPAVVGAVRVLNVDLARSSGYHELRIVPGGSWWFATDDGKGRLAGTMMMLQILGEAGLSWRNQLFFSSGDRVSNPHVEFAWLSRHGREIVATLRTIATSPRSRPSRVPQRDPGAPAPADLARTFKVVRANLKENLEARPRGPIPTATGARYAPRIIVAVRPTRVIDTPANRRAVQLGLLTAALCRRLASAVPEDDQADLGAILNSLRSVLARTSVARLANRVRTRPLSLVPTTEEILDPYYRFTYARYLDFVRGLGWVLSAESTPLYSYVKYADEIYQAFAALLVAKALDCAPARDDLRPDRNEPSFAGESYEIYYNASLPGRLMRTWRRSSARPDSPRPDIVVRRRVDNWVAVVDAKYRRKGNRCSDESLSEVQYYLNTFGIARAGIFYPPEDPSYRSPTSVAGENFAIAELPLGPWQDAETHVRTVVRPALETLFLAPSWREAAS